MNLWQPPADMLEPNWGEILPPDPVVLVTPERRADAIMEQHFGSTWAAEVGGGGEPCVQLWVSIVAAIKAAMGVQAVPQMPLAAPGVPHWTFKALPTSCTPQEPCRTPGCPPAPP